MNKLNWLNLTFITLFHALAAFAIVYVAAIHFAWPTLLLGAIWFLCCGISITGGYHRLFSHRSYEASPLLRAFYLLFGAASFQTSAITWCADHRQHHSRTDTEEDPYNRKRGFWWSHIGWIMMDQGDLDYSSVKDLFAQRLVRWQHRFYMPIAVFAGFLLPAGIGALWGDAIGGLLVGGMLRLVFQWHVTWSVNSVAHTLGTRPYSTEVTARDSFLTALLTLGEGYHNFHHRFQADYRNGVRWWQFDPTKWFVWCASKVRLTRNLRRVPARAIQQAKLAVRMKRIAKALPY